MKHILLINPARKRMAKSYRLRRAPRRKVRRARALRNKPLSAVHKRKISLAIKRRNRSGGARRKSRPARRSLAVARRPASRSVARRRSSRPARRSAVARRRGGGLRGFASRQAIGLKSLFSRETLTVAGGAVGATMLSSYVLLNFRSVLPFANNPIGVAIYRTGIGLGGAMLTQRFNRSLAQGMLIGTAVMVINDALAYVLNMTNRGPATTAGAYYRTVGGSLSTRGRGLATPPTRGAGAIRPGEFTPGYQASTQFGGALNNQSAFPSSAWSN